MCKSICRDAVTQDLIIPDSVSSLGAGIACVAFDGVDIPILNFLDDTNMIGQAILRPGFAIGRIPVKEDNHTGHRCGSSVCPLSTILEPVNTPNATGKLGNDTGINIAALVGTPGYKAGTPSYTGIKAIGNSLSVCHTAGTSAWCTSPPWSWKWECRWQR